MYGSALAEVCLLGVLCCLTNEKSNFYCYEKNKDRAVRVKEYLSKEITTVPIHTVIKTCIVPILNYMNIHQKQEAICLSCFDMSLQKYLTSKI